MQLFLPISSELETPIYQQIVQEIKNLIESSALPPKTKLPSTRELSQRLGVSRSTATMAYAELERLGYIWSPSHAGTFVRHVLPVGSTANDFDAKLMACEGIDSGIFLEDEASDAGSTPAVLSSFAQSLLATNSLEHNGTIGGDCFFRPPLPLLPAARFHATALHALAEPQVIDATVAGTDSFGFLPLRKALCDYLARARRIFAGVENVMIFSSSLTAMDFLARMLVDKGDVVFHEEPGSPETKEIFAAHGASLHLLQVDTQGMALDELHEEATVCLVSPSCQLPTGMTLSLPRRQELSRWAKDGRVIIEDDRNHEFVSKTACLPSLKSLNNEGVIYMGSFSTSLHPLSQLAYVVLPKSLIAPCRAGRMLFDNDVALIEQAVLAKMLQEGSLERHVRRLRTYYMQLKSQLIQAINRGGGRDMLVVSSAATYLSVRGKFAAVEEGKEKSILKAATSAGLPVLMAKRFYSSRGDECEFLISFAHLNERMIDSQIEQFRSELNRTAETQGVVIVQQPVSVMI